MEIMKVLEVGQREVKDTHAKRFLKKSKTNPISLKLEPLSKRAKLTLKVTEEVY
jgi:hypothetical protein